MTIRRADRDGIVSGGEARYRQGVREDEVAASAATRRGCELTAWEDGEQAHLPVRILTISRHWWSRMQYVENVV